MGLVNDKRRSRQNSTEAGVVVATFTEYQQATDYVEKLIAKEFPAGSIAIVGNNLRTVERVRGRLDYGVVAMRGAMVGAWLGLMIGIVFVPQALSSSESLLTSILLGVGVGMLINMARFALARKKRGFISVSQVIAKDYEVQVPSDLVAQAKEISAAS